MSRGIETGRWDEAAKRAAGKERRRNEATAFHSILRKEPIKEVAPARPMLESTRGLEILDRAQRAIEGALTIDEAAGLAKLFEVARERGLVDSE